MSRKRHSVPPALPEGLRICETCGEARGTTVNGRVSACYCSGLICLKCGGRARRPISDYYSWPHGYWSHVPYFGMALHGCPEGRQPLAELPSTPGHVSRDWWIHEPDRDVRTYQEATTAIAWAEVRGEIEPAEAYAVRITNGEGTGYALRPSGWTELPRLPESDDDQHG